MVVLQADLMVALIMLLEKIVFLEKVVLVLLSQQIL